MTKHDLKELAAIGAELGAAKAENEAMRILLRESYSELLVMKTEVGFRGKTLDLIDRIDTFLSQQPEPTDTYTAVDMATAAAQGFRDGQAAVEQAAVQDELWAVHAQGPDELYAAFSREDAEQHAAALNALPMPAGIQVSAVVIASPWSAAEHWKYLAEQEREHAAELKARAAQTEQATVKECLTVQPMAYAVFAANGNVVCFSTRRDHPSLVALESDGHSVVSLAPIAQTAPQGKFRIGDLVKKSTGSEWVGRVVGWYSTEQTKEGYAVESSAHRNSVQIYPVTALEAVE
jgi:hypothetical protein